MLPERKEEFLLDLLSGSDKLMNVKVPGRELELNKCVWNQGKQFTRQINSINSGVRGDI